MTTYDDKSSVNALIAGNGWSTAGPHDRPDDPPAVRVTEYVNHWGKTAWGIDWATDAHLYRYANPTEYIQNPRVIWTRPYSAEPARNWESFDHDSQYDSPTEAPNA